MPDLNEQLSQILSNPEAQRNIQNLLSSLQGVHAQQSQNPPPPDFSSLFGGAQNQNEPTFPDIDISTIMKMRQIFSKMSCDDQNINLLRALKPHLKKPEKIDEAINILRLISILPALKESGIFGGNFP